MIDGSILHKKARLVARGFKQIEGIELDKTFELITHKKNIRGLISIATDNRWTLCHMDVKLAFSHGELEEEVYIIKFEGEEVKRQA